MRELQRLFQPNEEYQLENMDHAVDWGGREWGTHRFHVHQLLDHAMDSLTTKDRAAVLGAGNHGDIDLPELSNHFAHVTILDTDANAIEEVLEQSGILMAAKVKSLTNVDYTCLDQIHFYETWEELLINHASSMDIVRYLKNCSFEVQKHEALPHLKKSFSLVISSSVHTQLFYIHALTQFSVYAEQYTNQEIGQIVEGLIYLRNSIVADYNRLLLSLLKPEGRLVIWTDMIRLDENKEALLDKLYSLHTEEERMSFLFRAFGEFGMEVAVSGLKGLYDHIKPEQQLFKSWVWLIGQENPCIAAGFSGAIRK